MRRRPTVCCRAAAVLRVLLRAARVLHAGHGKRQLRRTRLGLEALRRRLLREGLVGVLRRHHRIHALTTRRDGGALAYNSSRVEEDKSCFGGRRMG